MGMSVNPVYLSIYIEFFASNVYDMLPNPTSVNEALTKDSSYTGADSILSATKSVTRGVDTVDMP
jgi:hypothetical protein